MSKPKKQPKPCGPRGSTGDCGCGQGSDCFGPQVPALPVEPAKPEPKPVEPERPVRRIWP